MKIFIGNNNKLNLDLTNMKYIKKFDSVSEMNTALASSTISVLGMAMDGNTPVINNKAVEPAPPVDLTTPFFVKDVSGSDNVVTIQKTGTYAPTATFYKSTDGENWTSMGSTTISGITATVPANGKLYLRCSSAQGFYNYMEDEYTRMSFSGNCNVGGNILSLLWGTNFTSKTTMANDADYALSGFFGGAKIVDASKLLLPTNTVSYCYESMFSGCTSLTSAPALPAATLTGNCYESMFSGCTSLTSAPALPAATLTGNCYESMFSGCTNLNYIKCLATTNIQGNCYLWISGVSATGTFVKAAGVTWPTGLSGIPSGWTVEEATE